MIAFAKPNLIQKYIFVIYILFQCVYFSYGGDRRGGGGYGGGGGYDRGGRGGYDGGRGGGGGMNSCFLLYWLKMLLLWLFFNIKFIAYYFILLFQTETKLGVKKNTFFLENSP